MDLQTHGAKKYPNSALLKSSADLGWSAISAGLRSHRLSSTPVIVPQHTELILAVAVQRQRSHKQDQRQSTPRAHANDRKRFTDLPLPWETTRLRSLPQFRQCYTSTCQRRYFGD